jgi:hypothetical protein
MKQKFKLILMMSLAASSVSGGSRSHSPGDVGDEALGSQERSHVFEMRKRQVAR